MHVMRNNHKPIATSILLAFLTILITPSLIALAEPPCANWTQRAPATSPSVRERHAIAYDSVRGVAVLFGGWDGSNFPTDTWEWNGTNWISRNPPTSPSAKIAHAMAFDTARGVTVLFGGSPGGNETWEWNGTNWFQRNPVSSPPARVIHAMAYDSARGVTVLFGGGSNGSYFSDTWEWNGTNWIQRNLVTSPPARAGHAMAYDRARSRTVLFGGSTFSSGAYVFFGDTWEWDGVSWTFRTISGPTPRAYHAMAYDSARGVTVFFGGTNNLYAQYHGDAWEWNGANWTQLSPATSPLGRVSHAMAFDSARAMSVMFGGAIYDYPNYALGDTWELDLDECPPATGSCCTADGTCSVTTQANCTGTWASGATCIANPCPLPPAIGSCCAPDGTCTVTTQENCSGPWTSGAPCNPNLCAPPVPDDLPTGACCLGSVACHALTNSACINLGGTYQGDNTNCDPDTCPCQVQLCGVCLVPATLLSLLGIISMKRRHWRRSHAP